MSGWTRLEGAAKELMGSSGIENGDRNYRLSGEIKIAPHPIDERPIHFDLRQNRHSYTR